MEQYIEKLTPLFQKVAEKIGQGAEFGYEVVYRQQITYGIIALFIAICGVSLFFTGLKLKVSKQEWEYGEGKSVLKVLLIILGR